VPATRLVTRRTANQTDGVELSWHKREMWWLYMKPGGDSPRQRGRRRGPKVSLVIVFSSPTIVFPWNSNSTRPAAGWRGQDARRRQQLVQKHAGSKARPAAGQRQLVAAALRVEEVDIPELSCFPEADRSCRASPQGIESGNNARVFCWPSGSPLPGSRPTLCERRYRRVSQLSHCILLSDEYLAVFLSRQTRMEFALA